MKTDIENLFKDKVLGHPLDFLYSFLPKCGNASPSMECGSYLYYS